MSGHPERPRDDVQRLTIGKIVAPQGLRGDVRMLIWTHFPERIPSLRRVYLDEEAEPRRLRSASVRGNVAILSIEGVDTREEAEALRGAVVAIPREEAAPLGEDEYYHFQLIGLQVFDEAGHRLGEVVDILETGANDVYVVRTDEGRELLLPAIKQVVLDIDLERGRMTVRPPEYYEEG